jgi:hypothetical protein
MKRHWNFHGWTTIILVGWLVAIGPGTIEGKLFPVVENVTMTAEQDLSNTEWVWVSGGFKKLRGNCNPRIIEWFLGDRHGKQVPVEYVWGKPEIRDEGDHRFYDWHVRAAPPYVLENNTYADVLHRCGFYLPVLNYRINYPWITRTRFWN